jgi:hypothetical protein
LAQVGPPQSVSVSAPFFIASLQVGDAQTPALQMPFWQSALAPQTFPSAQVGQALPPQSTSVSVPFFIPSLQVAAGVSQTPPMQAPEAQSVLPSQALPISQWTQVGPPQSTSVSAPFFAPSLQVGAFPPVPVVVVVLVVPAPPLPVVDAPPLPVVLPPPPPAEVDDEVVALPPDPLVDDEPQAATPVDKPPAAMIAAR